MDNNHDYNNATPNELASTYMQLRDAKRVLNDKVKQIDEMMREVEQAMLSYMNANEVDSFKVAGVATVSRGVRNQYSCADWNVFLPWLLKQAESLAADGNDPTQVFSFFQKRVSSTEIADYMERHDGMPPPAINVMPEYTVSVRVSK